jgi:hypothetical protein
MIKTDVHLSADTPVDVILPEAEISVKMVTGYYLELQNVIKFIVGDRNEEEISNALDDLFKGKEVDPWVYHYHTLLRLCIEFETSALNQGFTKKVPFKEYIKMFDF